MLRVTAPRAPQTNGVQHHVLFCEESLGKIDAELSSFSGTGRSTNSIGSLESIDNFGTSAYFSENFDGEAINWSYVENFHLYENESCDEHAVYFRWWLKWRAIKEYLDLYLEITRLHTTLFSQKSALLRCVTNAFKISSFCYIRVCFSLIFLLIWRICFHSGPLPMIFVANTFFH